MSDIDAAQQKAQMRLDATIASFLSNGFANITGEVGDAYPLTAIQDALRSFPAQAILISTWPVGCSNWLAHNVVEKATKLFPIPIHHITAEYAEEAVVVLSG